MDNKLNWVNAIMLIILLVSNFMNMTPEQRKEAVKVTIQSLDSLNKSFSVVVQKDSLIKTDTLVIAQDSVKADTLKKDSLNK